MSEAVARLKALLGLDSKPFEDGMTQAGHKAESFGHKFEKSLVEMRGNIQGTQHAIVGVGEAMDGSVKGMIQGFRGLIHVMETNPVIAFFAAVSGSVLGAIKMWEEYENKAGEAIAKTTEAWVKAEESYRKVNKIGRENEEVKVMSNEDLGPRIAEQQKILDAANKRMAEIAHDNTIVTPERAAELKKLNRDLTESSKLLKEYGEQWEKNLEKETKAKEKSNDTGLTDQLARIKRESDMLGASFDEQINIIRERKKQIDEELWEKRSTISPEETDKLIIEKAQLNKEELQLQEKHAQDLANINEQYEKEESDSIARAVEEQREYSKEKVSIQLRALEEIERIQKKERRSKYDHQTMIEKMGGELRGKSNIAALREADIKRQKEDELQQVGIKMQRQMIELDWRTNRIGQNEAVSRIVGLGKQDNASLHHAESIAQLKTLTMAIHGMHNTLREGGE